jgi:signal transduction histidine kinase
MAAIAEPIAIAPPSPWRQLVAGVLRLPLFLKLTGANALIVVLAWTAVYLEQRSGDWRLLVVLAAALAAGMAVNIILLVIALRPIKELEATAARVWKGDLGARVPWSAVADPGIERLSVALNFLIETLSLDRRRARALTEQVVRQGEEQRAEVARQLQESIAQSLAGQVYLLKAALYACDSPAAAGHLEAAGEITRRCIEELRQLSGHVHPRLLDEFGLVAAVRHLARTVGAADGSMAVDVRHDGLENLRALPRSSRAVLYDLIEEAVRNAVRHSGATRIDINITGARGTVSVEVADNGAGFDTSAPLVAAPGSGLGLIREHLAFLGGECGIYSTPGEGTSVTGRLPLPDEAHIIEPAPGLAGAPLEAMVG